MFFCVLEPGQDLSFECGKIPLSSWVQGESWDRAGGLGSSCSHALCAESQLLFGSPRKKAGNTKALWNYSGGRDDFIRLQESAVGK